MEQSPVLEFTSDRQEIPAFCSINSKDPEFIINPEPDKSS